MMHIEALSAVIGRPIFSLYPDCNTNTHPLFHKRIVPRDCATKKKKASGSWYQGKQAQSSTNVAPDKGHHDGVQKRKQQKISDFFASKKVSPQLKKVRIPPVKKQCLEEDEGYIHLYL